jgi:hypothetical protein
MWDHARGTPWPGKRGDSVAASEMNKIALAIVVFAAPAHADRPDLTPFVGSWAGKRESVNIDANGYGWSNYMDVQACQRCAISDMPYTIMRVSTIMRRARCHLADPSEWQHAAHHQLDR